jgi:LPXTG-site transpeptidase (sortase) family protein
MRGDASSRFRRGAEWALLAVGVACLAAYGWTQHEIQRLTSDNQIAVTRMLAEREGSDPGLIGELEIPRLHFSAAVRDGDDDGVLTAAVGYLPDTALPWTQGNSVFAAHRDRLFKPLEQILVGDDIRLSTRHGDFQYRVSRTFVVDPGDVWVLGPAPGVDLTLITCYPFVYVGHAPHRFIVRAQKTRQLPRPAGLFR